MDVLSVTSTASASSLLTNSAAWVSLAAFAITLATFIRVHRLSTARRAERELVAKALRLQELTLSLEANAATLDGNATAVQQHNVQRDLVQLAAELDTATRLLAQEGPSRDAIDGVLLHRDGYWTDQFANEAVRRARRHVTIVTWRNSRALSVGLLEEMFKSLARFSALTIDIFAVACNASDEVFETMATMLTLGTASIMRREQVHHREVACEIIRTRLADRSLNKEALDRLSYYETCAFPAFHCIVIDDDVYWGINFFMDPASGATDVLNRAYISTGTRSEFGRKALEQVGVLRNLATTEAYTLR